MSREYRVIHMSWEYRVIHKNDGSLGSFFEIHEVYYNDNNEITCWSADPVSPFGGNVDDFKADLDLMRQALEKPIVKQSNLKAGLKRIT